MPKIPRSEAIVDDGPGPVMVFDGQCVFCSAGARFVHRFDKRAIIRFAHAQSPLGRRLYEHYGWNPVAFETNIFIAGGVVATKWATIAAMGTALGGVWSVLRICALVPDVIGDPVYDLVARNRYRIFGQTGSCMVPDAAMASRMVDTA